MSACRGREATARRSPEKFSCNYLFLSAFYNGGAVMIIRSLKDTEGTDRDVSWGNGQSRRLLIEKDGMQFSLTDTIVNAGSESLLEYKNHLEACYCIEGEGEVEAHGIIHPIKVGTMYALDKYDQHYLRAKTKMRLVCVFSPALKGTESHSLKTKQHGMSSSY